jgi:hypothetical protein
MANISKSDLLKSHLNLEPRLSISAFGIGLVNSLLSVIRDESSRTKKARQSDRMGKILHAVDESPLTQIQIVDDCREFSDFTRYWTSQRIAGCHSGGIQQNKKSVRQSSRMGIVHHSVDESPLTQRQK